MFYRRVTLIVLTDRDNKRIRQLLDSETLRNGRFLRINREEHQCLKMKSLMRFLLLPHVFSLHTTIKRLSHQKYLTQKYKGV